MPEEFNAPTPRKPDDYSDVGQVYAFAKHCRAHVRYSPATDYLVYDGICWQESKSQAQAALHVFTDAQLDEAERYIQVTQKYMDESGATAVIGALSKKEAISAMSEAQRRAFYAHESAIAYKQFVIKRRPHSTHSRMPNLMRRSGISRLHRSIWTKAALLPCWEP